MKNIVLIGMRGSGKTVIGKALAEHLNFKFIDVDKTLEKSEQTSIAELVKQHDWEHFRDLESAYVAKAAKNTNAVIATGGGVVLRAGNIAALKKNGVVVLLHSPLKHLQQRVARGASRPSLTGEDPAEELEKIWEDRKELYEEAADIEVFFDFETKNKKTDLLRKSKIVLKAVRDFQS
ncbi:MAG: shikimate kinase [Patescibacteria group bacterium]